MSDQQSAAQIPAPGTSVDTGVGIGPGTVFVESPPQSGCYLFSGAIVTWSRAADGTLSARGAGQEYVGGSSVDTDGTRHLTAMFAMSGESPYLSIELISRSAARSVTTTVSAGTSQVTLAITEIDFGITSGAAMVSGTLVGSPISWAGAVDLTVNPLVGTPVQGWPRDAFAPELNRASIFGPVSRAATQPQGSGPLSGPLTGHPPQGGPGHVHPMSELGVFGRAEAWCLGGALAGSPGGPAGAVWGCVGGAAASVLNDLVTWADEGGGEVEPEPVPVIVLPPDPEPTGPDTETQPDDPPPWPSGDGTTGSVGGDGLDEGGDIAASGNGAGGGKPADDDETVLHEA